MDLLIDDISNLTAICSDCGNEFNPDSDDTSLDIVEDTAQCPQCPKPIIHDVEKVIHNNENGESHDYDDFVHDNGDILLGGVELTINQLIEELPGDIIEELMRHFEASKSDLKSGAVTIEDIYQFLYDNNLYECADNSYNWGYYGPTYNFITIGADMYDSIGLVRFHRGGDIRGNYSDARACHARVLFAPDSVFMFYVNLETNRGNYSLDARGLEGYHFALYDHDNNEVIVTGTLEEIEKLFNMEDSDIDSLECALWT